MGRIPLFALVLGADIYWDLFGDHPLTTDPSDPTFPGVDREPPNTKINKHPHGRTDDRRAIYRFEADDAGATFDCRLDKKSYKRCESPEKFHVKRGKHTFRIRATDGAGNGEEKPAKDAFRVIR
jgi:hypothetical protein